MNVGWQKLTNNEQKSMETTFSKVTRKPDKTRADIRTVVLIIFRVRAIKLLECNHSHLICYLNGVA